MAQATNTTLGEIVLAGDLFGNDANAPSLVPSGVDPGTLSPMKKIHVDSKGRITWSGPVDYQADLSGNIPNATKLQKGAFVVGRNISVSSGVISLPVASANEWGVVKVGTGLEINQSTGAVDVSVPDASASNKGFVQIGSGLSISSGVLSHASWADATTSSKGLVKAGTNISVDNGVISVPDATGTVKGVAIPESSNFYLDPAIQTLFPHQTHYALFGMVFGWSTDFSLDVDGKLTWTNPYNVIPATDTVLGYVKIGSGVYIGEDGMISPYENTSTSVKGLAEIGTGITVVGGVISIPNADENTYGVICPGVGATTYMASSTTPLPEGDPNAGTSGLRFRRTDTTSAPNQAIPGVVRSASDANISIANGVMDVGSNIPKKDSVNTYTKAQVTQLQTYIDTDWSRGNAFEINMTGNIASVPAPTNAVAGQIINWTVKQDATGNRTMTGWDSVYKFQNGTAPVLSTAANTTDIITIICKSSTEFYVLFSKGYQ